MVSSVKILWFEEIHKELLYAFDFFHSRCLFMVEIETKKKKLPIVWI